MQYFTLYYNEKTKTFIEEKEASPELLNSKVKLHCFLHQNFARLGKSLWQRDERPAMVICPGGSYYHLSQKEGELSALHFMNAGFQAFLLDYSVGFECEFPKPLEELAVAIAHVRGQAKKWKINPNQIVTMGFSAGGNLVGMLGNHWSDAWLSQNLNLTAEDIQPNAQILSYAFYSGEGMDNQSLKELELAHYPQGMASLPEEERLLAYRNLNKLLPEKLGYIFYYPAEEIDLQKHFNSNTPPSFLWHTQEDTLVPAVQAISAAHRLTQLGVPCALHLFTKGKHGLARADREAHFYAELPLEAKEWLSLCRAWLKDVLDIV